MNGIKIRELVRVTKIQATVLASDIEFEKKRKERAYLEKELERVENEENFKRRVHFIKSTSNVKTSVTPKIGMSSSSMPNTSTNKTVTFNVHPSSS